MDMKRIRRQPSPAPHLDPEDDRGAARAEGRPGRMLRLAVVLLVGFIAVPLLVVLVSGVHLSPPLLEVDRLQLKTGEGTEGLEDDSVALSRDKLLGGLLASGFDEASCLSRYQSFLYRKASPHIPSPYLLQRLRKYEALHIKCGPNTKLYNETIDQLRSDHRGALDCNYLVWISYSGLGNRILSLASAFLYALLTNRVLLVDRGVDMGDLFCEPFPEGSWLLPLDFPLKNFSRFGMESPESYGNMLKKNSIKDASGSLPGYIYLHLAHDYGDHDKLFFCEDDQLLLEKIPWLVMRTDNYFVPSLFLIQKYEEELNQMFPERDTVFHHLGRYLLHPTNSVWGLITRYYQAYLAKAEERVGIQIRVFDIGTGPFQHVMDQILACTLKEKLLPDVNLEEAVVSNEKTRSRSRSILVTSLSSGYFERIRDMYWEHPTANGEMVGVYQPSQEEHQQMEKQMHNMKAWAEMYLLSLTDALVTSAWSTFGYVAQGLGGLRPWILVKPENRTAPDPPCGRAVSMEPCFHAPPFYDCKAKRGVDTGALVPHVTHCEDMSWGLKLVNRDEW